jgi:hypothetical protein
MRFRCTLRYEPLEDRRFLAAVTVTTLADTIDLNDGLTSLREAIFATNLLIGPDTIDFDPALFTERPSTITLVNGELKITDDLGIIAPGGSQLVIDASGSDPTPDQNNGDGSRIFNIDNGHTGTFISVTISGTTLLGGDVVGSGGAILSRENISLIDCRVDSSSAVSKELSVLSMGGGVAHRDGNLVVTNSEIASNVADFGGGIYLESGTLAIVASQIGDNVGLSGSGIYIADGDASIRSSWIHGNAAGAFSLGGGIYSSGNLRVESTTISGNSASFGGGLFSRTDAGGVEATRIINSTISGNTAFTRGGGIRNAYGLTVVEHSTITGNQAPAGEGSGIGSRGYNTSRTEIRSTIIAGNTSSDVDVGTGTVNTFQSRGFNLIGIGNAIAAFAAAGDQTGNLNPLLGPLVGNGGSMPTHALLPGSPALNAGDPAAMAGVGSVPLSDQRGAPFARVFTGWIDIGALESQPNPLVGDYNFNGVVDAGDYVQWRDTRGSMTDLRADGNGDGLVNDADRFVWIANYGRTAAAIEQGVARVDQGVGSVLDASDSSVLISSRHVPAAANLQPEGEQMGTAAAALPRRLVDSRTAEIPEMDNVERTDNALLIASASLGDCDDTQMPFVRPPRIAAQETTNEKSGLPVSVLDRVFETLYGGQSPPRK